MNKTFVRGREKFQKNKRLINVLVAICRALPRRYRAYLLVKWRKKEGVLWIGLRYVMLKTLALSCGDNVAIYSNAYLLHPENMRIGSNVTFQPMVYLEASGGITVGSDVSFAHGATVMSETHVYADRQTPFKCQGMVKKPVVIGNDVWIGAKATILLGVTVGSGAVIAAHSVVNRDVAEFTVMGGAPAKILKYRGEALGSE